MASERGTKPLDPRLVGLVQQVRRPLQGRLDLWATASGLGIRLQRRPMAPAMRGATVLPATVVVNLRESGTGFRFTAAHEIGHVLVAAGRCRWVPQKVEEPFADAFARELLVPRAELASLARHDPSTLASAYEVEASVVLLQLAAMGLAPALMRLADGTVLCAACGEYKPRTSCRCVAHRQRPELPLPSELSDWSAYT